MKESKNFVTVTDFSFGIVDVSILFFYISVLKYRFDTILKTRLRLRFYFLSVNYVKSIYLINIVCLNLPVQSNKEHNKVVAQVDHTVP